MVSQVTSSCVRKFEPSFLIRQLTSLLDPRRSSGVLLYHTLSVIFDQPRLNCPSWNNLIDFDNQTRKTKFTQIDPQTMSDLQAYLASKYMTGAKAEAILDRAGGVPEGKRRKKRKVESLVGGVASGSGPTSGMVIADDNDESSWKANGGRGVGEDEEEEGRPG